MRPSASGARVPCHSPCPHAGDEGQKKRSPGRRPVPYSAATIRVTRARCECLTASGSSRVVPEVYWNTARSSARVFTSKVEGSDWIDNRKPALSTSTPSPMMDRATASFSSFVTSKAGWQSLTRRRMPSGPNSVNSGTAIAPLLMTPNIAT
ncbi:hypothetical protein D9M69_557960 [compost metagenome]